MALLAAIAALFDRGAGSFTPLTGDEPHYLMTVLSLVNDGDFDETNNYAAQQCREFGYSRLAPQNRWPDGRIMPEHGLGFPLLLAMPFRWGGMRGIQLVLMTAGIVCGLLLCAMGDRLFGGWKAGTAAGVLLVCLPVWETFLPRAYPEVTAGTAALGAYLLLTRNRVNVWSMASAGLIAGLLPLLYTRFTVLAAFLILAAMTRIAARRSFSFWLGAGLGLACTGKLTSDVYGGAIAAAAPGAPSLSVHGWWEHYWRAWFDRGHGIAVENPVLLLWFWAAPALIARAVRERKATAPAVLAAMAGAYSAMFGFMSTSDGESAPGRFFCAMAPLALAAILLWVNEGPLKQRAAAVGAMAALSIVIVVEAMAGTPPWLGLGWYQDWFARAWDPASFVRPAAAHSGESGVYGWALLAAVAATKAAAWAWRRRNSAGKQSQLVDGPPVHSLAR